MTTGDQQILEEELVKQLTGAGTDLTRPSAVSAPDEGGKLQPNGAYLPFPGNTFLFHLHQNVRSYTPFKGISDALKAAGLGEYFAFLPDASLHMTIFCGASGNPPGRNDLSDRVEQNAPLETYTSKFEAALSGGMGPDGFSVSPRVISVGESLRIRMSPANELEGKKLLDMRRYLEDVTGIRRGDIENYEFHISLAYPTKFLEEDEARSVARKLLAAYETHIEPLDTIELGQVEFCRFKDMRHFEPLGYLRSGGYYKFPGR